jgi:hypothetical protein
MNKAATVARGGFALGMASPPSPVRDGISNRPKHVKTPACLLLKNEVFTMPLLARTVYKS